MFGKIVWIYGMSGSGKTTLGTRLAQEIGFLLVDGDIIRNFLGSNDDFTPKGRREHQNQLRGYLDKMRTEDDLSFVVASITPYEDMRKLNRDVFKDNYYEVLLDCKIEHLIKRDPKGLYAKASRGEILHFTGISDLFERGDPDLIVSTDEIGEEESYKTLIEGVTKWLHSFKAE